MNFNFNNVKDAYNHTLPLQRIYGSGNYLLWEKDEEEKSEYYYKYLTFNILQAGELRIGGKSNDSTNKSIYYNINDQGWIELTTTNVSWQTLATIYLNQGDLIMFKSQSLDNGWFDTFTFSTNNSTCFFDVYGNIHSLIYGDNFINNNSLPTNLSHIFEHCNVVNAKNLILPAKTLIPSAYYSMFSSCDSLISSPELPATTLADNCYEMMFWSCDSLISAPKLPAITLAAWCYKDMFCNCISLVTAPKLSATTLADNCYYGMFAGCTSLTTAPDLLVNTFVYTAYTEMFKNCTRLNYIKCMTELNDLPYVGVFFSNWVSGVAATGTFVKKAGVPWLNGASGIPTGWTVIEE